MGAHWYHEHNPQQKTKAGAGQFIPTPPPPTPQLTSRPIKERWITGERKNSIEKVIARKSDSGGIKKACRYPCNNCGQVFKHDGELALHTQTVCHIPSTVMGFNNFNISSAKNFSSLVGGRHPSVIRRTTAAEKNPPSGPLHIHENKNKSRPDITTYSDPESRYFDLKDPARVCILCTKLFIDKEYKKKHDKECEILSRDIQHTYSFVCCHCGTNYKTQRAMVRHTNQCSGKNASTSPLGSIVSDDQEVEISIPDTAPLEDPHIEIVAGLQHAAPEETQSTEDNSRVNTEYIMSATDEPTHAPEERDPLQPEGEIDIKEDLYDLIQEHILERVPLEEFVDGTDSEHDKVPLEEYGESTAPEEAEFKHIDFDVPDEILQSPNISFSSEDKVNISTSDLPMQGKEDIKPPFPDPPPI